MPLAVAAIPPALKRTGSSSSSGSSNSSSSDSDGKPKRKGLIGRIKNMTDRDADHERFGEPVIGDGSEHRILPTGGVAKVGPTHFEGH